MYTFINSSNIDVFLLIMSSHFSDNYGSHLICSIDTEGKISVMISNSTFNGSKLTNIREVLSGSFKTINSPGVVSITALHGIVKIIMYEVNFTSNRYPGYYGGALNIALLNHDYDNNFSILIKECKFVNNTVLGHGAAVGFYAENFVNSSLEIANSHFDHNFGSSVVYISPEFVDFTRLQLNTSVFTNNIGSSMYISAFDVELSGDVLFENNTAENGGAMYLNREAKIYIKDGTNVQFINNSAAINGGAIYLELEWSFGCNITTFYFNTFSTINVIF